MKENHSKNSSYDNDGKQINKFNNKSNFSTFLKNINNQNPVNPVIINNNLNKILNLNCNACFVIYVYVFNIVYVALISKTHTA